MAMINFILTYNNLENIFEAISVKKNICETAFQSMQPIKHLKIYANFTNPVTQERLRDFYTIKLRLSKSQTTTNISCVIHITIPQNRSDQIKSVNINKNTSERNRR